MKHLILFIGLMTKCLGADDLHIEIPDLDAVGEVSCVSSPPSSYSLGHCSVTAIEGQFSPEISSKMTLVVKWNNQERIIKIPLLANGDIDPATRRVDGTIRINNNGLIFNLNFTPSKKLVFFEQLNGVNQLKCGKLVSGRVSKPIGSTGVLSSILTSTNINGSIVAGNGNNYVARSQRLGMGYFGIFNKSLPAGHRPILGSSCIDEVQPRITHLIRKLASHHYSKEKYDQEIKEIQEWVSKRRSCQNYLYHQSAIRPAVFYTHMRGYTDENPFALESILMAKIFGYEYYHPYHPTNPVTLTGVDPFRTDHHNLSPSSAGVSRMHFYNPRTLGSRSPSALKLLRFEGLTEAMELERMEDVKYSGNIDALLDNLDLLLDPKHAQTTLHCMGGKHKTGIFFLAFRYLQSESWLYGEKLERWFMLKRDDTIGLENTSSATLLSPRGGATTPRSPSNQMTMRLNPAEQEYVDHNSLEVRLSNLTSMRNLFDLFYNPSPEKNAQFREFYGISEEKLNQVIERIRILKSKFQAKFPN